MNVKGRQFETIWLRDDEPEVVQIIDQRYLPFEFRIEDITTADEMCTAISHMHLRGAPLIGVAGAFGLYLALLHAPDERDIDAYVREKASLIRSVRPTAVNLAWAVDRVLEEVLPERDLSGMRVKALETAKKIMDDERRHCRQIGEYGLPLIRELSRRKNGDAVNILTHCNAGWLACVDYGTATAPIYLAHDEGIPVHVIVDETRPRNQGAKLTAWELREHGVPFTLVADNAGGHMMQRSMVDLVIVGSDRTSPYGDVANKIGTYLKALAARDNDIPFYAALPSSSIDWSLEEGAHSVPIEERSGDEIRHMGGMSSGTFTEIGIVPEDFTVANYGFDITPARLVTGLITERGIARAVHEDILNLFPEKNKTLLS